jgi:type II secretory pathway pseudopilin PulG
MPIPFTCPHCKLQTVVDDRYAGKSGPCAGCGVIVIVPLAAETPMAKAGSTAFRTGVRIAAIVVGIVVLTLACVGIVTSIALPTVTAARDAARKQACTENLRRIAEAMNAYHDEHGHFPPAYTVDDAGKPLHSWRVLILPYLGAEERAIYNQLDLEKPWDAPENTWGSFRAPTVYQCPSDPDASTGMTSYMVVTGKGTIFEADQTVTKTQLQQGDGATQTILVVESSESSIAWNQPIDITMAQLMQGINSGVSPGCRSKHPPGGIHIVYADGSIQFVPDYIEASELQKLSTIAGGEVVSSFD